MSVSPIIDRIVSWFRELGNFFDSFFHDDYRISQHRDDLEMLKEMEDLCLGCLYDYTIGGIAPLI